MHDSKMPPRRSTYGAITNDTLSTRQTLDTPCPSCGLVTGEVRHGSEADCVRALVNEVRLLRAAAGETGGNT
jgi:hypothetical protein